MLVSGQSAYELHQSPAGASVVSTASSSSSASITVALYRNGCSVNTVAIKLRTSICSPGYNAASLSNTVPLPSVAPLNANAALAPPSSPSSSSLSIFGPGRSKNPTNDTKKYVANR